jgi:hypothetical protein
MARLRFAVVVLGLALGAGTARAQTLATPDSSAQMPLPESGVRRWQVGLARPDRLLHVSASLTVGLSFGLTTRHPAAALAGGMAWGLAKELYDIRRGDFDVVDMLADLIGAAGASGATAALTD